jgi:SMC interacting uncharacterized protein involved in chromosome segregation
MITDSGEGCERRDQWDALQHRSHQEVDVRNPHELLHQGFRQEIVKRVFRTLYRIGFQSDVRFPAIHNNLPIRLLRRPVRRSFPQIVRFPTPHWGLLHSQ